MKQKQLAPKDEKKANNKKIKKTITKKKLVGSNKKADKQKVKKTETLKTSVIDRINELLRDDESDDSSSQSFKGIKWKHTEESEVVHYMFVRKHVTANVDKEKPSGRTIICQNIPPYLNEKHVRQIFNMFGTITKVYIDQKHLARDLPEKQDVEFSMESRGFKVAHVVYNDSKSIHDILELETADMEPIVLQSKPITGMRRWIHQYNQNIVSNKQLESSVKRFMSSFDEAELRRKEMEKNSGQPDDDGWVTVTRTGKRASGGAIRSEAMEERLRSKKKRKDKQLLNFTPAQVKETKMKQLLDLKKKFEEDKQRVALLKQQRKFKPF